MQNSNWFKNLNHDDLGFGTNLVTYLVVMVCYHIQEDTVTKLQQVLTQHPFLDLKIR